MGDDLGGKGKGKSVVGGAIAADSPQLTDCTVIRHLATTMIELRQLGTVCQYMRSWGGHALTLRSFACAIPLGLVCGLLAPAGAHACVLPSWMQTQCNVIWCTAAASTGEALQPPGAMSR